MYAKKWLIRVCCVVILLTTLSCQVIELLVPDKEPTPTSAPEDTPLPPTDIPIPTPSIPFPAPKLLERSPQVGEAQALEEPIELVFDQPMDPDSAADAFSIKPPVKGDLVWVDNRTLSFVPKEPLDRGSSYTITVDQSAQNAEGKTIVDAYTFDFNTVGYLEVSEVQPSADSMEVNPDMGVTVVFNRPVVPLTSLDEQDNLPQPLTFDPPVAGHGEWLNTSIYRFYPDASFMPSTAYTARVEGGLTDTLGYTLSGDFIWEFTAQSPYITHWLPRNNARHIGPSDVISVTFSQPMDQESVEDAFEASIGTRIISGAFAWEGGETPLSEEVMTFTPDAPLMRDALVKVFIGNQPGEAKSANGQALLSRDLGWQFYTVRTPGIKSTEPQNLQSDVSVGRNVRINFASPMATDVFTQYLTISPEPEEVRVYWSEQDTQAYIYLPDLPQTQFQVVVDKAPDKYGATLPTGFSLNFTTGDLNPLAVYKTNGSVGSYNAYTNTVVYAQTRNVSSLEMKLYSLALDDFMKLTGYSYYDFRSEFRPDPARLVREWTLPIDAAPNTTRLIAMDMVNRAGVLPPGIYYVTMFAPDFQRVYPNAEPDTFTFIRSHTNLVLKQSLGETLVWATDLASGEPVADLPATFYAGEDLSAYGKGTTDTAGLHYTTATPPRDEDYVDLWADAFAVTGLPGEADFSVVYNNWDDGIRAWNFDLPYSYGYDEYIGYVYTDRSIYRPDQMVYFKGVIRADDDASYTIPDMATLDVTVTDPDGTMIMEDTLAVSDMGTYFGELALDESASLGYYYIQVFDEVAGFYTGASFRVAEYRKPEFQVTVQTAEDAYLSGDTIDVSAQASYYFGGPVADADLHWNLLSAEYWFSYECPTGEVCPRYSWTDFEWGDDRERYGSYGSWIGEGDTVTDGQGQVLFDVPADISDETSSRILTVDVSVTDISEQQVSNRNSVIVHQGEYYIGVAPRGRIADSGESKQVDILTVDWDSQPVEDEELQVVFNKHEWYSVREESESGRAYWTWSTRDVPVYTTTVTTGDDGEAIASFVPEESGTYKVRVTGEDDQGNEIRSSTYIWVWGGGYTFWRQESNNRIDLIVDQDSYDVGDVARILVPSPYENPVNALITIERGYMMDVQVVEVEGSAYLIEIPITEDYVPNMFVSVILMEGSEQNAAELASFKMGQVMIPVSTESKELNVTLTPDRDIEDGDYYRPRETMSYRIRVTDASGKPVQAELSLRTADLAVLALLDDTSGTMLDHFWRERGLSVRTSTTLAEAMEAYNREMDPGGKGGGGGAEDGGFVRSEFADTAYWNPTIYTDADGEAVVQIKLPDNLTTWRTQARAITEDTLVGRVDSDVMSTLDVLVRPVLPRFFVVGDKADIATIVHNNTGETLETEITLTATGVTVDGETEVTVDVPAGDQVEIVWPVTVEDVDEASFTMEASAGDYYDGREDVLPVYRYLTPEVMGTAGRISEAEARQEIVQLPREYDPDRGELTVQIDGSLTAATQDSLRYVEEYPYDCTEQTVSRFLPNVMAYQALTELGIDRPELEAQIQESLTTALQKLYNEQHYDGGWGWWSRNDSNPYLTAYVVHAMLEAHQAGFAVDLDVVESGVDYLRDRLQPVTANTMHWKANRLAYQFYVIARYVEIVPGAEEMGELGFAVLLFEDRQILNQYAKAQLAVALSILDEDDTKRVNTLLDDLVDDAVFTSTGTHWEEARPDYWNMNTDIHTTSTVIWALSQIRPDSELLPNAVRWLMSMREADAGRGSAYGWTYWESTHTTSWALMSLVEYMKASGELDGEFSFTVSLNGAEVADGEVNEDSIDESTQVGIEIADLMSEYANRLIIERTTEDDQSGEGQLYYTAHLRYFQPAHQVEAADRGISVVRQYSLVDNPDSYITGAQVGDVIRVKLTVIAPTDLHYVMVEDPLPAGCEAVDVTLNTTSAVSEAPEMTNVSANAQDRWYRRYGWGWWYFSHSEMRDEKVSLFATYLPRGTYEYTYIMRASVAGEFNVIPTTASEMYFPEVWGRSDGVKFVIEP